MFKIAPLELESILLTHPKVQDVAVVGKPHPLFEELPTAFVVKRPGVHVAEHELLDFVASEVTIYFRALKVKRWAFYLYQLPGIIRVKYIGLPDKLRWCM